MVDFPMEFLEMIIRFEGLFSKTVFIHTKVLLAGAIFTLGKRTLLQGYGL